MPTDQEVFDKVAKHLLTQGERSTGNIYNIDYDEEYEEPDDVSDCAYRGDNGLMCAVGCLIPDEVYLPSMEGQSVSSLLWGYTGNNLKEHLGSNQVLLQDLQDIHDETEPADWKAKLVELAQFHSLSQAVLCG